MRLGVCTSSFFNRVPVESTFDVLRQMRIDTAEFYLNTYSEYEKPFIDMMAALRGAVNVHSVHAVSTQFEPQLFSRSQKVRRDAENLFKKVCYACCMLGAKFYTFVGPIKLKRSHSFDFFSLGQRYNQLSDIAAQYGVRLSLENAQYSYASTPDFFKNLFTQCPYVFGTLDVQNAFQAGEDIYKLMDAMDGRISTIHISDITNKSESCLPGKGKFNFEKFFRELDKRCINTQILIEVASNGYGDLNEFKTAYDTLNFSLIKVINT